MKIEQGALYQQEHRLFIKEEANKENELFLRVRYFEYCLYR